MSLKAINCSKDEIQLVLKTSAIKEENYRFFHLGNDKSIFVLVNDGEIVNVTTINIGIASIVSNYFKSSIPTESEVEYAINDIEDDLMRNKELMNSHVDLYSMDALLIEALRIKPNKEATYTRVEIENLFTRYAHLSMGKSPVLDDLIVSREIYAQLLITREILHHLNYKKLIINASSI